MRALVLALLAAPAAAQTLGPPVLPDTPMRESGDPAADAIAAAGCDSLGSELAVGPGLVRMADLDGDGTNDAILDLGAIQCTTAASLNCGTGGCLTQIWLGHEDGPWSLAFEGYAHSLAVVGPGVVEASFHGTLCGGAGADPCGGRFWVENGGLVPTEVAPQP